MKLTNSFRDAAQIRQARGLDAFRSREEEENLRAWERVAEIADELGECSDSSVARAMKELQELAHKRLSFADELGFSEQEMESCETASGMIVATEGVASASEGSSLAASATCAVGADCAATSVSFSAAALDDAEMFDGDELEEVVLPSSLRAANDVFPGDNAAFAAGDSVAGGAFGVVVTAASGVAGEPSDMNALTATGAAGNEIPELLDVPARPAPAEVATFKHLCAGRDGKLCLFEDADGHLVAVRASRLA